VFGYEAERRALAMSLGVDPYTTIPVPAKKLNDMAYVGFSGRPDLQETAGSLCITVLMSPGAQRQFAALGWTIHQNVFSPLPTLAPRRS
jgi:hypothetical protein